MSQVPNYLYRPRQLYTTQTLKMHCIKFGSANNKVKKQHCFEEDVFWKEKL